MGWCQLLNQRTAVPKLGIYQHFWAYKKQKHIQGVPSPNADRQRANKINEILGKGENGVNKQVYPWWGINAIG